MKRLAHYLRAFADRIDPPPKRGPIVHQPDLRECADHPGHYPSEHCPATECRYPHCRVDRRRAPTATDIAGSSLCTARRCTIQPYHSPCAYQTALADRREARRKATAKTARKTGKAKR